MSVKGGKHSTHRDNNVRHRVLSRKTRIGDRLLRIGQLLESGRTGLILRSYPDFKPTNPNDLSQPYRFVVKIAQHLQTGGISLLYDEKAPRQAQNTQNTDDQPVSDKSHKTGSKQPF